MINWLAAAGLTITFADVSGSRLPELKSIVMVSAIWYLRLEKLATPLAAVAVNVPNKVPDPWSSDAVITVELSLLRRFPYWSSTRTTGCCPKTMPAVGEAEGWVWIVNRLAGPGLTTMLPEF